MSHTPLARQSRKSGIHYLPSPTLNARGAKQPLRTSNLASTGSQTTPSSSSSSFSTPQSKILSKTHRTPIAYSIEGEGSASPWTPSRSAKMPFDMKASMRAAQEAEREQAASSTPVPLAGGKRKRIVRKRPIWDRITSLPHDVIDTYFPDSLTPPLHWAAPIAVLLHIVHFLLRAPLFAPSSSGSDSILRSGERDRWEGRFENSRSSRKTSSILGSWSTILYTVLVLSVAISNAFYVFTRFRRYDMQLRSAKDSQNQLNSPNAHAVPAPGRDDVFANPTTTSTASQQAAGLASKALGMTWRVIKSMVLHLLGYDSAAVAPKSVGTIQSLNVWDPPDFNLLFFCYFPPPAPLLSYLLYPSHPFLTPFLHLIITLQTLYLTRHFQQLVKDRQYLTAEVMREYDQRFVYPKVFAMTSDKGVMTHEAEVVW